MIPWFSVAEVAEQLGKSHSTAWRLIRSGKIPSSRFGRDYSVKADDLEAYLRGSRVEPVEPPRGAARQPRLVWTAAAGLSGSELGRALKKVDLKFGR